MPIQLIKPTNAAPPVAMRFGTEIVTLGNIGTSKRETREPQAKAYIIGALECGLFEKQAFHAQYPDYTEEALEVWKTIEEVAYILGRARGEIPEKPKAVPALAPPENVILVDERPPLKEKTYTAGKWRLRIGRNTLCYGVKEIPLASSTVRALALLFCNPEQWVTKGILHQAVRNKPIHGSGRDGTVGAVFHDLQRIVEGLGGPQYPIETTTDGNNYRLKVIE